MNGLVKTVLLAVFFVASVASGYVTAEDDRSGQPDCQTVAPLSAGCILKDAIAALDGVGNDQSRVVAAVELALASSAAGYNEFALSLLADALEATKGDQDNAGRVKSYIAIAKALIDLGKNRQGLSIAHQGHVLANGIEDAATKWDLLGKLAAILAAGGEEDVAVGFAVSMPYTDDRLAAYKARTLREIAAAMAKKGDFTGAAAVLQSIKMGLPYYRATARADIALLAANAGKTDLMIQLLGEAADMARLFENGYFVAGALRDVGEVYARADMFAKALSYFEEAGQGARGAPSRQEQARALSRIASGLSDVGRYDIASGFLDEAILIAGSIESDTLKGWTYYEIVGSLAFAGKSEKAIALLSYVPDMPFGSSRSLANATRRDVAWGLARHKRLAEAVQMARAINTARERVQALCRIVRVMQNPAMAALPRYL